MGDIAKEMKKGKTLSANQSQGIETQDNRRYIIEPPAHERIMELVAPRGVIPMSDLVLDSTHA